MEVSKSLQDTITSSTFRKKKVNALINLMKKEVAYKYRDEEEHSRQRVSMKKKFTMMRNRKSSLLVMEKLPTQNHQVKNKNLAFKTDVFKL